MFLEQERGCSKADGEEVMGEKGALGAVAAP